jgi:pre-mRNA branch site protein p14
LFRSFNVTPEELFDLFGKFGPVRYVDMPGARARSRHVPRKLTHCSQIRQGIANNTKGTAFVVYEDVMDAKSACDKLNGFNFQNRYLVGALHILQ